LGRPEPQRDVRHAQHVILARDLDCHRRGHSRLEFELWIRHGDDGRVDHHVLDDGWLEPDLRYGSPELFSGVGVDGEGHGLVWTHPADVGLVNVGNDLHLVQVFCDHNVGADMLA
jgi:hypothetical protein